MNAIKMFALAAVATIAPSGPAMAATITYTLTGSFSGVNGGPFNDVPASFIGTSDAVVNGFGSFYTPLTSLRAVSPTVGTFNVTTPAFFYVNGNGYAGIVFGALSGSDYFSGNNDVLPGYTGKISFATTRIAYFDGINATFDTDRGSVTISSAVNGTFSASLAGAVPEPATWAMMIGGFGMVGGAMRRRRVGTKVSFA